MEVISQNIVYFIIAIAILVILLAWAYATGRMQKDFSTVTWVLIPVAIAINGVIGYIVGQIKLPVFLDSIGTVLVGALCGPWAGALTGALSNFVIGMLTNPTDWWPWIPVAFFIGLVAGFCANAGFFKSWWKVVVTGFLIALTAATVSTPIAVYFFGGITSSGSSFITAYLLQTGQGILQAVFSTNFLVEPVDKISTAMLAFAIVQGLSRRFIARFPRPENVETEGGASQTQLFIAIGVVVLLILFAVFVLSRITAG
jgi:energy-coupling factor transport system substrate-specific component